MIYIDETKERERFTRAYCKLNGVNYAAFTANPEIARSFDKEFEAKWTIWLAATRAAHERLLPVIEAHEKLLFRLDTPRTRGPDDISNARDAVIQAKKKAGLL